MLRTTDAGIWWGMSEPVADPIIEVAVIALPDGSTCWIRSEEGVSEYAQKVFAKFKAEHPELEDKRVSGGVVLIRMLESSYNSIPATNAAYCP